MAAKAPTGNPILREITSKREQLEKQILAGVPQTFEAYLAAIGSYRTLVEIETFTTEQLKKGDHVDD